MSATPPRHTCMQLGACQSRTPRCEDCEPADHEPPKPTPAAWPRAFVCLEEREDYEWLDTTASMPLGAA